MQSKCALGGPPVVAPGVVAACCGRLYLVDLRYTQTRPPNVFVRRPRLVLDADGRLPHIHPNGNLCMHESDQWVSGDPIAETILPWTCEWLLHYEFWLATGTWSGSGGNHADTIGDLTTPPKTPKALAVAAMSRQR